MSYDQTNNTTPSGVADKLLSAVATVRKEHGKIGTDNALRGLTVGVESLQGVEKAAFGDVMKSGAELTGEIYSQFSAGLESFADITPAMKQAGAIALAAVQNPVAYAKKAMAASSLGHTAVGVEGRNVVEPIYAGMDFQEAMPSLEAYDTTALVEHADFSVAWNIEAVRQSPFSEAFFKTIVSTPDQAGAQLAIDNIFVMNEIRHSVNGKAVDFKRKNLIRAIGDASILAPETTRIYPVVISSGSDQNTSLFVASSDVPATAVTVAGDSYNTAPLKIGTTVNLLGLSSTPRLLQSGVVEQSDSLDSRLAISAVYVKFTPGSGTAKVVKFDTTHMPRSAFVKSAEGNQREVSLQMIGRELLVTGTTVAVDGTGAVGASALTNGNYKVKIGLDLVGAADVQIGNCQVSAARLEVIKLLDADNNSVDFSSGAGQTLVAGLGTPSVIGYDVEARRTNSNKRSRGLLLDTNRYVEQYKTYLGAPISVQKPTNSESSAAELAALIAATRIRNDNQAVTTLINYRDMLLKASASFGNFDEEPQIEGIGRIVIRPYLYQDTIDVAAELNSIMTHQRDADIREVFGNILRRAAYDMLYHTQYQPALEMISGGTNTKPHVTIGADPVIQKYLYTTGDSRLFGDAFDFTVVSTIDKRVEGQIFMVFTRKDVSGLDPLSFGSFIWIPELASTAEVSRNGQISREVTVQPRTLYAVTCPAMVNFTVSNLKEAANNKTSAPAVA